MSASEGRLAGRTVVVTRSPEDGAELARRFEAEGARVLLVPTIEIEPTDQGPEVERALSSLADYDGIILGSQNAAERLFSAAARHGASCRDARFFVVGAKTASFVQGEVPGARVEAPAVYRAEALVELIRERFGGGLAGRRFLFPRAPEGRELIIDALSALGAEVQALHLYRIVPAAGPPASVLAALDSAEIITFMSGRSLENWLRLMPEPAARAHLRRAQVALIGPVAQETAARLGIRVDIVPEVATAEGLVEAVAAASGGTRA